MGAVTGATAAASHAEDVAALLDQYRRLPQDAPVRLSKRTSNLFRFSSSSRHQGLNVQRLNRVLRIDPSSRTAEIQGMTTYEDIVHAHLPLGYMPLVIPQLKTITLGGAVAGLGIEASSFRSGLPHESVREMDILTGNGTVVTATATNEHAPLFRAFPNSYGTLGYALRLVVEIEPIKPYVWLRHLRFDSAAACAHAISEICQSGAYQGWQADFLDGTVFEPSEMYLTVGTYVDDAPIPSDYTGANIYYQSIRRLHTDHLTTGGYLWRWDTDWFWCSRGLGVQHPLGRRLWPRKYRRSDVYRKVVAWDRKLRVTEGLSRVRGRQPDEPVIQDVEIPVDRLAEFLDFFHQKIGISPIWLCPVRLRDPSGWPLYPMDPDTLYVNVGFWSAVAREPGQPPGSYNRAIEDMVTELGGHKSLYSTSYYEHDEFWQLYNRSAYQLVKQRYDPAGRLGDLYEKCVRAT